MGVWLVAGGRGAPGVSTLALALGMTWPSERRVRVIEADPDGGTFAARYGHAANPGLADMVPELRRGTIADWTSASIAMTDRFDVIAAPPTADEAGSVVRSVADSLVPALLADGDTDSILDLGRLRPQHPLTGGVRIADATVVAVHPGVDSLVALRQRVAGWPNDRTVVAVMDRSPFTTSDLREFLGAHQVVSLPSDQRGADSVVQLGRFTRTALARAASTLASELVAASRDRIRSEVPSTATTVGVAS